MPPGPPAESLVGTVIAGRYRVIQLLGSGGTGHVYMAEPVSANPPSAAGWRSRLALKVLRAEHEARPELVARFERESVAAVRIRHANVLEVHGLERTPDGRPFFAMELLVGLDLADTLAAARSLRPSRAVRIASGAAEGLGAAHGHGVVHRDVKPENIFLVHAPDGRELVKLLDFGFASLREEPYGRKSDPISARLTVVGTPEYMAPEQAQGAEPHPAADIYSLGIALYEMLAGRVPFLGRSYPAIAHQHVGRAPASMRRHNPSLSISEELDAVVHRALAKSPQSRFDSMEALRRALLATPEARRPGTTGS